MVVTVRGKNVKLPDFLVVGAAKSGTTTLYYCLIQHPQIFMPKGKEPRFFSFMERPPRDSVPDHLEDKTIIWRFEDYIKLFESAKEGQVIGEGSVGYLYTHNITIDHIKSIYGEKFKHLKIIAILRNPVDRAFSQYLLHVRGGMGGLSFEEAVYQQTRKNNIKKTRGLDYVGFGMYYHQVKAYMEEFPHVKIYLFEDLKNINDTIKDLFGFLGVEQNVQINTNIKANPSGIPKSKILVNMLRNARIMKYFLPPKLKVKLACFRDDMMRKLVEKPELDDKVRGRMIDIFKNDIVELQKLIKRDLSHWMVLKQIKDQRI